MGIEAANWHEAVVTPDANTAYFSICAPETEQKITLEDRLSVQIGSDWLRACIADGHWGAGAAEQAVEFWSGEQTPRTRDEAVEAVTWLEGHLVDLYGSEHMDSQTDLTPETAFTAIAVEGDMLTATSYGDCRTLLVRHGTPEFTQPTVSTWLGVFSHLGLRDRRPVSEALKFSKVPLLPNSYVLLYTDGLDEWNHDGKPSMQPSEIAKAFNGRPTAKEAVESLAALVFNNNPLDDVSLLVYQHQARPL